MAPVSSALPARIGRYEILEELGSGAMGTVYLARDTVLGRSVALKTFRSALGADAHDLALLRKRLLREAQTAGLACHPHVVTVYDVIDDLERGIFIAMELVEGVSLQSRLQRERRLSLAEALAVASQVASALDHLHDRGVVHRDLKPANILITAQGTVKLTDFGVALPEDPAQTQETAVFGTPQYMAPEQIQGLTADARTDVFSLGVLLYEMLLGRKPFRGATVAEVTHSILYEPPRPARAEGVELSPGLVAVLGRALAKSPADRYGSAGELAEALRQVTAEGPRSELDTAATAALRQPLRRPGDLMARVARTPARRWLPLAVAALLAGVGLSALAVSWQYHRSTAVASAEEPSLRQGYYKLLTEGRRLMAEGDPQAAAVLFAAAEGFATDPAEARQLRQAALKLAEDQGIQVQIEDARQALAEGRYEHVIASARALLGTRAGYDEALRVLTEVESALSRPPPQVELPSSTRPRTVPRLPVAVAEPATEAAVEATLEVALDAGAPRGVITIYADGRQVLLEPFDFYRRRAWLWKAPHPGQLTREIALPPETGALRVLVARAGEPARLITLPGPFPAGSRQRLEVVVPEDGEVQATLHP
jgi:tRNA A-37 threonylcarbamoyl transferase component Bud32